MYIIRKEPNPDGSRPPLQSWDSEVAPEGYALCPDEFLGVFYSTTPAGFVEISTEEDVVTAMEINGAALEAYIAEHPEPEPVEPVPSELDDIEAMLVEQEYRLTLLELGVGWEV